MGSSESKMTAATKAEPVLKKTHISHLIDPRSPTAGIDRTPIQVGEQESKTSAEVKNESTLAVSDPRSPSVGISRTPMREVMRLTVGSFARRLGMLFHNEAEGKVHEDSPKSFDSVEEAFGNEELASTVPLLIPHLADNFDSLAEHANLLATPVQPPLQIGDSSPFVLLEEPQVEVEVETETDVSLEEAEEARESPLHKRLSMSLITCHEGATSVQIFAEVHQENTSFPEPSAEVEPLRSGVDHSYALPSITIEPESCKTSLDDVENSPVPEEAEKLPSSKETKVSSSAGQVKLCTGIRCPTFDTKSPSQLEFKPQWLGKGFGATGLRARGVQGNSGKAGQSPLAFRLAVKNATNENKGPSGKLRLKDSEGRSPLQILNSPRDQRSQMKLKVSNQDKPRLGQMDRRVLAVCLDKENR